MKKFSTFVLLYLVIFFLISCLQQNSCKLSDKEKVAIEKEIEFIVRNFLNAETIGYETHTGLRANQPGYIMGGEGKIKFRSYSEYQTAMKVSFSGIQKFTEMNITELYSYALSKDAATCTTKFNGKFLTTSGDSLVNNGCWTFVFKKFDKEWKVIQENGTHTQ